MAQQQVWAALEVALRVPCLYIIDAIFNSYYDSSQSRFCIGLQILFRLLGKDSGIACGPRVALSLADSSGWAPVARGLGSRGLISPKEPFFFFAGVRGTHRARANADSGVVLAGLVCCSVGTWMR